MTFICYPKCSTCKKAKAFLDDNGISYELRDIVINNPNYGELRSWLEISNLPIKKFFNTSGNLYKSLGLKDKLPHMGEDECLELLATNGMLIKRPLLIDESHVLIGFKPDAWKEIL